MTKDGYTIAMGKDISLVEVGQWLFRKCILQVMPHYNYTKRLTSVVSNLMNHEKTKNIGEFHQQDKLPPKLLRLQAAKVMHWKWLNFRLPWA